MPTRGPRVHNDIKKLVDRVGARFQTQDPEKLIVAYARECVQQAIAGEIIEGMRWEGPPFQVEVLASMLGHTYEPCTRITSDDAELHPNPDLPGSRIIRFNPDKPLKRRNFSIAHELAHTFFDPAIDEVCRREKPKDPVLKQLEDLCDIAAAELLMPYEPFTDSMASVAFDLDGLAYLSGLYAASQEATANRMVSLGPPTNAATYFYFGLSLNQQREQDQYTLFSQDQPEPKLRVDYSVRSARFPHLPRYKSVPDDSPLYEVHESHAPYSGPLVLSTGKTNINVWAHAAYVWGGSEEDSRVLALLRLTN